jgi:hypothetical protein
MSGLEPVGASRRKRYSTISARAVSRYLALDTDYGTPDVLCGVLPGPTTAYQGASEYVWRHDGMVIRAIFRDTTLQAWGGCYSPACGLTAQLLIRISPPAEDKGTCPPLPTGAQLHAPR